MRISWYNVSTDVSAGKIQDGGVQMEVRYKEGVACGNG
jgi:hypothetical protein